jgi:hypothetical protein
VLDDALRGVGIRPHPEPVPGDVRRLTDAGDAAQVLLGNIGAALSASGVTGDERRFLARARAIVAQQAEAVGASSLGTPAGAPSVESVITLAKATADERAADAFASVSPEVAEVLASMAAGLDQLVVAGKQIQ